MTKRTQKLFVLKRTDGGITVLQILNNEDGTYPTIEETIAKMQPDTQKEIVSWREIEPKEEYFPRDLTFRDAWCDVTPEPKIDIDMPKARNIHRNRLRELRKPKLDALDIESMKAVIAKDEKKTNEIEAKKQVLRDVTIHPAIEAASTPEELMKVIPF